MPANFEPLEHDLPNHNEEYTLALPFWGKCRDAIKGEDALKAEPKRYLPSLPDLEADGYKVYVKRASYYGAPGETVSGLTGTVLRKPPVVQYPEAEKDALKTLGVRDEPLSALLRDTLTEVLTVGRTGFLVDSVGATPDTPNPRPYVTGYKAEAIAGRPFE
jgi:hypothetical protein